MPDNDKLPIYDPAGAELANDFFRETIQRPSLLRPMLPHTVRIDHKRCRVVDTRDTDEAQSPYLFSYPPDDESRFTVQLLVAYVNGFFTLTEPFKGKRSRAAWWKLRGQLVRACPMIKLINVVLADSPHPRPRGFTIVVPAETDKAIIEFLGQALLDMRDISDARLRTLVCPLRIDDDTHCVIIDRDVADLLAGRRWRVNDANSRIWDGQVYLDQILCPHDPLTHRVRFATGKDYDFTRHNLRLKCIATTRQVTLDRKVWALLYKMKVSPEQALADRVAIIHR